VVSRAADVIADLRHRELDDATRVTLAEIEAALGPR
jgi:hypothetical protein